MSLSEATVVGGFIDLSGMKYGRLNVIKRIGTQVKSRSPLWLCKCDCGNYTEVTTNAMRSGNTKSCGCLSREENIKRSTKHGMSHTRLDHIYRDMKQRCYNKKRDNYKYYGGRGINICNEWMENPVLFFEWSLENGYSDELSIDRIDVNGDYCPENCRWATLEEQFNNKTDSVYITYNDKTLTVAQWSKETGIHIQTILSRIRMGWTNDQLFRKPRKLKGRNC